MHGRGVLELLVVAQYEAVRSVAGSPNLFDGARKRGPATGIEQLGVAWVRG